MRKRILVIDDDRKFLKIIVDALRPRGFEVLTASNGETGLQIYQRENPDLLLVDGLLPRLDGFQFCERVRNGPKGKDIPIVMMTAVYKMPEKEREARIKYKVQEYLTKPIDLKVLFEVLQKHLDIGQ